MAKFWGSGKFPYTQLNNLNLDWLIKCVRELAAQIVEAVRGDIAQNKSAEWKTRARQNIDAASASDLASLSAEVDTVGNNVSEAVRGDIVQNKSAEWKTQARRNIDAQSTSAIIDVAHGGTGATNVVDALNALASTGLLYFGSVSSELVLNFSGAVRFLIIISSTASTRQGAAIVYCGYNASPVVTPIGTLGTAITLTGGTSSLTVSMSSAASATSVILLCLTAVSYGRITAGQPNSLTMLAEEQTSRPAALDDGQTTNSPTELSERQITSPSALAEE